MLVVLGLDSLDAHWVDHHATPTIDSFTERGEMKTPEGLGPDELITGYLWPSMLMGEHPVDAFPGQYQDSNSETTSLTRWNNPVLDSGPVRRLERIVVERLSRRLKDQIKGLLSKANVEQEKQAATVLEERGSLLDAASNPKLISIPGINADDSNTELKSMVSDRVGNTGKTTKKDAQTFERAAARGDIDRLIRTLWAVRSREHDLVFTHFYSLDLIQHIWVNSETKMDRWYYLYDRFVSQVLRETSDDDTVVLVSDHGMQSDGIHSKRAFYAASKEVWGEPPYKMVDLREVLQSELESHRIDGGSAGPEMEVSADTKDHLENLGYFES